MAVPDSPQPIRPLSPAAQAPRRLGRNINGYFGETIDIAAILKDCVEAARTNGWEAEEVPVPARPHLIVLRRSSPGERAATYPRRPRVYLSTGIHGDEPAGPLAASQLLQENRWPPACDLWFWPCLNPAGFQSNRRENPEGIDLNRDYLARKAAETQAHVAWLEQQPSFDLCLCLHEDWEAEGFYVYELNPDQRPSLAEAIVAGVSQVCPIDFSSLIEGRPAQNGIIRPSLDPRSRPQWPEAFFLLTHKTRLSYTLEAPSDFPLPSRVAALVAGAEAALRNLFTVGAAAQAGR